MGKLSHTRGALHVSVVLQSLVPTRETLQGPGAQGPPGRGSLSCSCLLFRGAELLPLETATNWTLLKIYFCFTIKLEHLSSPSQGINYQHKWAVLPGEQQSWGCRFCDLSALQEKLQFRTAPPADSTPPSEDSRL